MTDTWSEEYRHQCEVRWILRNRKTLGSTWANEYLDKIERTRGKKARAKVESDCRTQWTLGNRGDHAVWFEPPVA